MKREFIENQLKDKGLSDEDIKSIVNDIIAENGRDINNERAKVESLKNDIKVKEALVEELNGKIKEAKQVNIEKIKKEQYELGKSEGSKELDDFKKTNALKASVKGAKDFDLVKSKLDENEIQYEKDEKGNYIVKGIDKQLKSIKEKYSYLFEDDKKDVKEIDFGGEHKDITTNAEVKELMDAMGIKE